MIVNEEEMKYLRTNFITEDNKLKVCKYSLLKNERPELYKKLGDDPQEIKNQLRIIFDIPLKKKGRKYVANPLRNPDKFCVDLKNRPKYKTGFDLSPRDNESMEDFIRSFYKGVIEEEYNVIGRILVFPEKNIAIQYCPLDKISELNVTRNDLINISDSYREKGIRSMHFYADEWKYRKNIVKSIIKVSLDCYDQRLFARKCEVRYLTKPEEKNFFKNSHLQGFAASQFCVGLIHNGEVVSAISLAVPRFSKEAKWELIRYANKLNTQIVGGFSKLLKFFREEHPGSIISYSDRRLFSGDLYRKMFTEVKPSGLGYYYTDGEIRENRQKFQKFKLVARFPQWVDKSEWEIAHLLQWYRVWDCGNWRFIIE